MSLETDLANDQVEISTVTIDGAMFFGGKPGGSDGFIGNIRQVYCNREQVKLKFCPFFNNFVGNNDAIWYVS